MTVTFCGHSVVSDYQEVEAWLEMVPKRFAILRRNHWMVTESDVVVAYVRHSVSNAVKTLEYAKQKKKPVLLYPNLEPQALPPWV